MDGWMDVWMNRYPHALHKSIYTLQSTHIQYVAMQRAAYPHLMDL